MGPLTVAPVPIADDESAEGDYDKTTLEGRKGCSHPYIHSSRIQYQYDHTFTRCNS